jgi:tRNA (Thr-GGU) A37 N-methylase
MALVARAIQDGLIDVEDPWADIIVITWLHLADWSIRQVPPRGDASRPVQGVFVTRSPGRPNPLGIHVVKVVATQDLRVEVRYLEALDKTPIADIKPALGPLGQR